MTNIGHEILQIVTEQQYFKISPPPPSKKKKKKIVLKFYSYNPIFLQLNYDHKY